MGLSVAAAFNIKRMASGSLVELTTRRAWTLDTAESEYVARLARVAALAAFMFGSRDLAKHWLQEPSAIPGTAG